jgi:predicted transcriptional regulator
VVAKLLNFRADERLQRRIDRAAAAVNVDRSTWIRTALEAQLDQQDGTAARTGQRRR